LQSFWGPSPIAEGMSIEAPPVSNGWKMGSGFIWLHSPPQFNSTGLCLVFPTLSDSREKLLIDYTTNHLHQQGETLGVSTYCNDLSPAGSTPICIAFSIQLTN